MKYSMIKRNELPNHRKTRKNFKRVLLSDINKSEKAT